MPTLNELYRPFRVGNDVTNPNPELKPEHLLGGEVAAEWQASPTFRLAGTAFLNRMEDAVGNVTIGPGPGGGVIRQRQNVDLVMAPGFEATAEWQLISSVRLKGSYLFTHPTIERAADPALDGKIARANSGKRFHRRHRVDAHREMGGERAISLQRPAVRGRSELARARSLHDL